MAFRHILNLSNSIVGVSILSMPYCFRTAGILLSILTIIISSFLNRFVCHLIIISARISKRKSFENLAYSVFGSTGKLITEIAILGFLLGSCVAFFVVIGDLCPSLIDQLFKISDYTQMTTRTFSMMFIGMFIALPLALKRRVEASFSAISMLLYLMLALNLFTEAFDKLDFDDNKIFNKLNYWNFDNFWRILPIFITCLSCQPQLFEIFDQSLIFSEDKNAVKKVDKSIGQAINLCSFLYIFVGLFGYISTVNSSTIEGNLLVDLPPSLFSVLAKFGFLFTIIFSLPICLFPCRTSLHSLLYGKPTSSLLNDMIIADTYIPDDRWIFLTVILIIITICISLVIPHIEFILGLIGSTTGTTVCFILPTLFFINLTARNTRERLLAFCALYFGIMLLIFSTFTLVNVDQQELSNQGQIIKNLNLSTNRLEKLIEKNKLDQIKKDQIDLSFKKDIKLVELTDDKPADEKIKDDKHLSSEKIKDDKHLSSEKIKDDKNPSNEKIKDDKNSNNSNDENNAVKLKDVNKNDQKDNNTIDKSRSGFINAVEKNRKNLSREKLESLKDNSNKSMTNNKLNNNQSKLESKLDKTINMNLTNNKVVKDSKFLDKKIIDKKPVRNKTIDKDRDFKK